MTATDCYRPTDGDRELFRRVKDYVNQHRGRFVEAALDLDHRYASRQVRHRRAEALASARHDPNVLRDTRAARRRRGLDVSHEIPPPRQRDQDGKWLPRRVPLVERFELAWADSFDAPASLDVMPWAQREEGALRRVLLAWLRRDPDRGKRLWLTEFQRMATVATEDGLPPSHRDDDEPEASPDTLWVCVDDVLETDAPRWIAAVADALAVLEGAPGEGLLAHAVDTIKTAHVRLICLEDVPAHDVKPERRGELNRYKELCIAVLGEAKHRVSELRKAHGGGWTPGVREEVSRLEYALDAIARGLRSSGAAGWTHPVPRPGGANEEACRVWAEHEALMIRMMNFLPTLDYGETPGVGSCGVDTGLGEDSTPAQPPAPSEEDDASPAPPAFSRSERLVLLTMNDFDVSVLASVAAISNATPCEDRVGERTTGEAIKKLIRHDLAERPQGPKGGARLTNSGRQLARRLREDCGNTAG